MVAAFIKNVFKGNEEKLTRESIANLEKKNQELEEKLGRISDALERGDAQEAHGKKKDKRPTFATINENVASSAEDYHGQKHYEAKLKRASTAYVAQPLPDARKDYVYEHSYPSPAAPPLPYSVEATHPQHERTSEISWQQNNMRSTEDARKLEKWYRHQEKQKQQAHQKEKKYHQRHSEQLRGTPKVKVQRRETVHGQASRTSRSPLAMDLTTVDIQVQVPTNILQLIKLQFQVSFVCVAWAFCLIAIFASVYLALNYWHLLG